LAQPRSGVQTLPKTYYGGNLFPDELREKGRILWNPPFFDVLSRSRRTTSSEIAY
jgi:hypothetical protein